MKSDPLGSITEIYRTLTCMSKKTNPWQPVLGSIARDPHGPDIPGTGVLIVWIIGVILYALFHNQCLSGFALPEVLGTFKVLPELSRGFKQKTSASLPQGT